jgi:mannose/fructose/N-acetylgalactosamine-specific phosphotransferase system component IID
MGECKEMNQNSKFTHIQKTLDRLMKELLFLSQIVCLVVIVATKHGVNYSTISFRKNAQ